MNGHGGVRQGLHDPGCAIITVIVGVGLAHSATPFSLRLLADDVNYHWSQSHFTVSNSQLTGQENYP